MNNLFGQQITQENGQQFIFQHVQLVPKKQLLDRRPGRFAQRVGHGFGTFGVGLRSRGPRERHGVGEDFWLSDIRQLFVCWLSPGCKNVSFCWIGSPITRNFVSWIHSYLPCVHICFCFMNHSFAILSYCCSVYGSVQRPRCKEPVRP